jgi:hypothetical protein
MVDNSKMSSIKDKMAMFERSVDKVDEARKEDRKHNNVHKLVQGFQSPKTSPKVSLGGAAAKRPDLPGAASFSITDFRPASPPQTTRRLP